MEATRTSETSVSYRNTTRRHKSEDLYLKEAKKWRIFGGNQREEVMFSPYRAPRSLREDTFEMVEQGIKM
jgi:hypothetical protein